jgi:hypothetical protein
MTMIADAFHCRFPLATKQMRWQRKQRSLGRCRSCGQASAKFARCLRCRLRNPQVRQEKMHV